LKSTAHGKESPEDVGVLDFKPALIEQQDQRAGTLSGRRKKKCRHLAEGTGRGETTPPQLSSKERHITSPLHWKRRLFNRLSIPSKKDEVQDLRGERAGVGQTHIFFLLSEKKQQLRRERDGKTTSRRETTVGTRPEGGNKGKACVKKGVFRQRERVSDKERRHPPRKVRAGISGEVSRPQARARWRDICCGDRDLQSKALRGKPVVLEKNPRENRSTPSPGDGGGSRLRGSVIF